MITFCLILGILFSILVYFAIINEHPYKFQKKKKVITATIKDQLKYLCEEAIRGGCPGHR